MALTAALPVFLGDALGDAAAWAPHCHLRQFSSGGKLRWHALIPVLEAANLRAMDIEFRDGIRVERKESRNEQ